MAGFADAASYLPAAVSGALLRLPDRLTSGVQEIRLRAEAPLTLSTPDGEWMVTQPGAATQTEWGNLLICSRSILEECFLKLCDYSVHTHQQELCKGYVTAPNGCRAGIAGTAITENGAVVSIRQITSICLRVARRHDGCATALMNALLEDNRGCTRRLRSTLICGEPSSGKSSLLKDLARQLSTGTRGRRYRIAVVDERGELSGDGCLTQCDVLKNCPKAEGIQQAVRCLAPDLVIFDEIGTAAEAEAVMMGLNAGVAAIATAHCWDKVSLLHRPHLAAALDGGAFEQVVFLKGRQAPGVFTQIVEARDLFAQNHWNGVDCYNRERSGAGGFGRIEPACRLP